MKRWIKSIFILCIVCIISVVTVLGVNITNKEEVSGETIGINTIPVYAESNSESDSNSDNQSVANVVCWGDSITYGLGSGEAYVENEDGTLDISDWAYTDALAYYTGLNVYNLGVCGETSYDIAMRQGGIKMYIGKSVTVKPGKKTRVSIVNSDGDSVLLENFNGYETDNSEVDNLVYIDDVLYQLSLNNGAVYISLYGDTTQSVKIKKGTQVVTKAAHDMQTDILIIEMGSNGGWDDYDELISQYKAMIANSGTQCYIIIGDTDNPDEAIDSENYNSSKEVGLNDTLWEAALREAFGDHFINMRTYLMQNALDITGKEANETDIENLLDGRVPDSIKYDYTHLNGYGYYAYGVGVYEKGVELGYW